MSMFLWYRTICADSHVREDTFGQLTGICRLRARLVIEDDAERQIFRPMSCYMTLRCPQCGSSNWYCHVPLVGFAGFATPIEEDGEPTHAEVSDRALELHTGARPDEALIERYLTVLRRPHKGRGRPPPHAAVGMRFC